MKTRVEELILLNNIPKNRQMMTLSPADYDEKFLNLMPFLYFTFSMVKNTCQFVDCNK